MGGDSMSLTSKQIKALRDLEQVWPDRNVVIIGATALGFYYDMTWRQTADVDLILAVEFKEFPGPLANLQGWEQHKTKEHQFLSPQGEKIDILPAGPELLAAGSITWASGHKMSLEAMDLAFSYTAKKDCPNNYVATVALPQVVVLLKMASYCDRPAERERDLADIGHLLEHYENEDSERRWDEAGEYSFELAPSFLLGLDIAAIAAPSHHELVDRFLGRVADPDSPEHALMRNRGPARWQKAEESLSQHLDAFESGRKTVS